MILLASQWLVGLIVLPLFYHPAAGNPADNGSGGKPYNEIYQVHFTYFLLSIVLYNPGFFSGSMRRKRLCVPIPGSKGTWCLVGSFRENNYELLSAADKVDDRQQDDGTQ
jgi:hypothetical protein